MNLTKSLRPAAIAVTLALAAAPAFAQREHEDRGERHGEQRGEQRGGERAQQRGGERGQARGDRGEAGARGTAARENRGGEYRGESRGENPGGEYHGENRGEYGRAVPRSGEYRSRGYVEPRAYGYDRPRVEVPVRRFGRPYYMFRPHFLLGYGIYIGYPVPYPVMYGYPGYVYGYPAGDMSMTPPPNSYGGVSFDITPDDASVAVDGAYVGIARDFSPSYEPLTLAPGRHHIELQAGGTVPLAFDVDVVPGQVIPYRGALQPY